MLDLAHWPDSWTPAPAVDDTASKSASYLPPASVSPPPAAAAGDDPAMPAGPSSRPSEPVPASPGSPAPAAAPDAPAPATATVAQRFEPAQAASVPPGPRLSTELSPPAPPASGAALAHPPAEGEAPRDTPIDPLSPQTLALTLGQSRRLHLGRAATRVLVASPDVADVQLLAPDVLYVIGKGIGRTSVAVLDDDEWVEERVVSVVLDLEPIRATVAGDPDLAGVQVRRMARGLVLAGEVASPEVADRAVRLAVGALPEGVPVENDLRIAAPQQVNLEVQIAEVHRSVTESLGVNWEAFGAYEGERFGFRVGQPLAPPTGFTGLGLDAFPPGFVDGEPASSVFFGSQGLLGHFRVMIDALAEAGLANVLARPNVTAISGESAAFFSGGEFPLPAGFDDGVLLFEYKKYGVLLDFVPTVIDAGRIVLTVRPEVSEPSRTDAVTVAGVTIPVINVRRAETTVEVGDGESIVIAGLFRNRSDRTNSGVPVLKDAPLLGALFGYNQARADELELIVVVTARLVQAGPASDAPGASPAMLRANGYHY